VANVLLSRGLFFVATRSPAPPTVEACLAILCFPSLFFRPFVFLLLLIFCLFFFGSLPLILHVDFPSFFLDLFLSAGLFPTHHVYLSAFCVFLTFFLS